MRWLVEVTSIGKTDKETFCVDADTWQRALQVTRTLRKDSAPMSGFSIELLDEGCRAVDPMARLRYDVKRTRDDTPLSPGAQAAAASMPASMPPPAKAAAPNAPVAATAAPAAAVAAPAAPAAPVAATAAPRAVAAAPVPAAPAAAPAAKRAPGVGKTTAIMGSAGAVTHAAEAKAAPAPPPPADVPAQVIFKREQDPTDASPIAYREYVFVVAQGTSEASAETVLRAQLEQVRASIAGLPSAKLVQLAAFDVIFKGRPPVRPLATLIWKDWRSAPEIAFPRRAGYVAPQYTPAPPPPAPVAAPAPPAPVAAPPSPEPVAPPPPPAPVAPPPPPARPSADATQPLSALAAPPAPPPEPLRAPISQRPKAPDFVPDFARTLNETRPASASMRAARPRARVSGDELIAELFESMADLHFLRDAIEGASFCLSLALEKLPSHFGIAHLYDIDRREFVVASTQGPGAHVLLLARAPESEPLLSAAMRKRRAFVVADASHAAAESLARFAPLGRVASMIVAPVMQSGRFLGAIELINPLDDSPFTDEEGAALSYIAEQLGEFIATVGVVTDPERITAAAGQPARR